MAETREEWIERQLENAPRADQDPERAARIARALGLTAPPKETGVELRQ